MKLLDFGLAHLLGSPEAKGAGTPAYMPPEQARGDGIDARADVYASAMVLREMLTGRREPGGEVVVPKALSSALEMALFSNRDARPRDGTAWLEELAAVQVAPRRPRRAGQVAGLVTLLLVLGVAGYWFADAATGRAAAGAEFLLRLDEPLHRGPAIRRSLAEP